MLGRGRGLELERILERNTVHMHTTIQYTCFIITGFQMVSKTNPYHKACDGTATCLSSDSSTLCQC